MRQGDSSGHHWETQPAVEHGMSLYSDVGQAHREYCWCAGGCRSGGGSRRGCDWLVADCCPRLPPKTQAT
eukprot:676558-Rhodomonas_salina.2